MNRILLALALSTALCAPAFAQAPMTMPGQKPTAGSAEMPMGGMMHGMSAEKMQEMRQMHQKMGQMMRRMQNPRMTPERRAEMMKQMAPMMKAMMPMMQEMMKDQPMPMANAGTTSSSTAAFEAAMMKMHADMPMNYSGDADTDFAAHMIPHHVGAVAMANTLLQYGKSPEMRKLAEDIVKGQTAEIVTLRDWLAKNKK